MKSQASLFTTLHLSSPYHEAQPSLKTEAGHHWRQKLVIIEDRS
ncbi:hypothetical protein [Prevotella sp. AM34-19LB]|nr:hypothetical protein [Prevotella sp. AM34-19LB]